MKKFYVHHNYTNDLFWYFFHATDVEVDEVPAYFFKNKNKKVTLHTSYKEIPIEINFCGEDDWNKTDGYHLFDIHIHLMQTNKVKDRGYSYKTINEFKHTIKKDLLEKAKLHGDNLHFFYIDWEGFTHSKELSDIKNFKIIVDEINQDKKSINKHYCFTTNFLSYIHTSELDIKLFYFAKQFYDNLKYEHKINYSVRRIIGEKVNQIKKFLQIPEIHITYSSYSFTKDSVDSGIDKDVDYFRKFVLDNIEKNYINKRGYGIHDWGNEENKNNIHEMMFKVLTLAEIEIIDEWMEYDYISEKSVIRILASKPFLPSSFKVFDFYNEIQKKYKKIPYNFSFRYESIDELILLLQKSLKDENSWSSFKDELKNWVDTTRKNLIDICYSNNSYLDLILFKNKVELI